jgi:hypothetical protein
MPNAAPALADTRHDTIEHHNQGGSSIHWLDAVSTRSEGASLNTPIERGSDAPLSGVHFSGPPRFGPLGIFFGFFFLLNLGFAAPNYSRKPPMKSSKAPPKQKNRGRFYPTPGTPS